MKQFTKLILYKTLIELDFLLINKHSLSSTMSTKNLISQNFTVLDLNALIKSLKQIIRLLQLFFYENNNQVYFFVQNKQYYHILKHFYNGSIKNENTLINVVQSLTEITTPTVKNTNKMLFIFDSTSGHVKITLYKNLFQHQFYLINLINTELEFLNLSIYKIFTTLDDYKKVLFFAILLENLIKNK